MATVDNFDPILNWKLKRGSHTFPGKDGGTCINEAAIVAAGFPFQPVRSVQDMPECFSRAICALAMQLNDEVEDAERQLLLPFVARLACADAPEVERAREAYIAARLRWLQSFKEQVAILEGALAIGRQANAGGGEDLPGGRAATCRFAHLGGRAPAARQGAQLARRSVLGRRPELPACSG